MKNLAAPCAATLVLLSSCCSRSAESYTFSSPPLSNKKITNLGHHGDGLGPERGQRTLIGSHHHHGGGTSTTESRALGLHQRVLRKVFRAATKKKVDQPQSLNMMAATTVAMMDETTTSEEYRDVSPQAVSSSFHPSMLHSTPPILEIIKDPSSKNDMALPEGRKIHADRGPFARVAGSAFSSELSKRLNRWSRGQNDNLQVKCEASGNIKQLLRGEARFNATINLDRIVFGNIRFSGGQLEAHNFAINLLSETQRFPNQFDLLGRNLTMTQEDLFKSSCIRNGLRRLLTKILKNRGLTVIAHQLTSITILPTGKISCTGHVAPLVGPVLPFEVRTGIEAKGNILSFPGLEISLNPSFGLFLPIPSEITVDMGRNAQLWDVSLDDNKLVLSAQVTITPNGAALSPPIGSTSSCSTHQQHAPSPALCSVDVGRWLTHLGRFAPSK